MPESKPVEWVKGVHLNEDRSSFGLVDGAPPAFHCHGILHLL
jgi:hypothetical protein